VSESPVSTGAELRKRRSTRIVQAVPLQVTGVDALGRPFAERTSTLIINCHGCRYQSKHYVLKNMWVNLEVPHSESGRPPRQVRGRVAWIQRPRTVRQLFQVALEMELPGNIWGIGFPPDDWFIFSDAAKNPESAEAMPDNAQEQSISATTEIHLPLKDSDLPAASGPDNLRVFPSPASATDASLQLARHVTRLLADAKQQIHTTARDAAVQAVSAERRIAFEQWEQKFAAARQEIAGAATQALDRIQQESEARSRAAQTAALEALQNELPKWLAPQLEQLTRDMTGQLSREGHTQRTGQEQSLAGAQEKLQVLCRQAEEAAARLRTLAEQSEAQVVARVEAASGAIEEAAHQREEVADSQRESLQNAADEIQRQASAGIVAAQDSGRVQFAEELAAARARWQTTVEEGFTAARERSAGVLNDHSAALQSQLREEGARQNAALRESLEGQAQRLEAAVARAHAAGERLEHFASHIETAQHQALSGFQSQLDDVLSLHRNELHRRSESLFDEINARIRQAFEETSGRTLENCREQIQTLVQPHVAQAEEAVHRLAGGRSLLDAALTLQQDRIRASADEAFAESMARFRENLGSVEQLLQESAQSVTERNLSDLDAKASDLKRHTVEEMLKSAEWYEKRAQTQLQDLSDKATEQTGAHLREKAGEISSLFASELNHSSQNFVHHTQTQLDEVVRASFERARMLYAEAADTTSAAFTDEIQRTARVELDGVSEELRKSAAETRAQMEAARAELTQRVTSEQEDFLRRFEARMSGAMDVGIAEARQRAQTEVAPLLESWKTTASAHQTELQSNYSKMSDAATEHYRGRLENVSNSWMLATVTTLDHRSREVITQIAGTAEERLRETCAQVFAGVGDVLRERLQQIAASLTVPAEAPKHSQ
jgi:hypothetical protein